MEIAGGSEGGDHDHMDGGSRGGDPQLMEILNGLKDEYEKIIADSGNFTMD
jgi:hypothetical protein